MYIKKKIYKRKKVIMKIGDLVKQKGAGVAVISNNILSQFNMDCVGIVVEIEPDVYFSYDGRHRSNITVQWSNGKTETMPEIYLEKIENEE